MRPMTPDFFDIHARSQDERSELHRNAVQIAHRERSRAVRDLFNAAAQSLRGRPLLVRALVDSFAVLAMIVVLGATIAGPAKARMASATVGVSHVTLDDRTHVTPRINPYKRGKIAIYCNAIEGMAGERRGCLTE